MSVNQKKSDKKYQSTQKTLALFDFDGTISSKDSFGYFLVKTVPPKKLFFTAFILAPLLVAYKLGWYRNDKAKEQVLIQVFKGMPYPVFKEHCRHFAAKDLPKIIRPEALEEINNHKSEGNRVIVISASVEDWLRPWTDSQKIELIGTKLDVAEDILTGRIAGKNCYGPEKVSRLQSLLDLKNYSKIYVYGDSAGDREMLKLSDQPSYKPFRGGDKASFFSKILSIIKAARGTQNG